MNKDDMNHELRIIDACIYLEGRRLFSPLNIEVRSPYPTILMGPSGSGKSSLLNWLSGHLPAAFKAEGKAYLDGQGLENLPPHRRRIGILFQDDLLFPHLNVSENLAFGVPRSFSSAERQEKVNQALSQAGLGEFGLRDPKTLSGGQRARVALLRALLSEPRLLLLDEPFSKLDWALRDKFRAEVFESCARGQIPVLMVTHDPADAEKAGGPVINLSV